MQSYQGLDVFQVLRFKEKPNQDQAAEMLKNGDHSWNSGMFVWRVDRILEEFSRQMPELYRDLSRLAETVETDQYAQTLAQIWPGLKNETIDYGVMEGAERVAVIPAADLHWSDVGSWDSLFEVMPADKDGNIVMNGQYIAIDTHDSLVYSSDAGRLIVTIGVSDLVVVDTGDVVLVCPKEKAQQVREVVKILKNSDQNYV